MKGFGKKIIMAVPPVIFGADGLIKHYVDRTMESEDSRKIFGGRLLLNKRYNEGAALGICSGRSGVVKAVQGVLLSVTAVCFAALLPKKGRTGLKVSFGLMLGGGASNFYDRMRKGHVVDYASVPTKYGWLRRIVFNLSDICILIGAVFLLFFGNHKKRA